MSSSPTTPSKKEQVATLYNLGITNVEELALLTQARPSYIAAILRDANVLSGYFDLYTTSGRPMNVYSKFFAGRLGFKDVPTARRSVAYIDQLHALFAQNSDRAGQHHALLMALTMFNRARWSNKMAAAQVFGDWLQEQLQSPATPALHPRTVAAQQSQGGDRHASR
jgi:hypothetical protein